MFSYVSGFPLILIIASLVTLIQIFCKVHLCFSIVTVERNNSYKLVNIKNINAMNRTQPVLSSQPHLEK